jgi:hypothetical protein
MTSHGIEELPLLLRKNFTIHLVHSSLSTHDNMKSPYLELAEMRANGSYPCWVGIRNCTKTPTPGIKVVHDCHSQKIKVPGSDI